MIYIKRQVYIKRQAKMSQRHTGCSCDVLVSDQPTMLQGVELPVAELRRRARVVGYNL